jgi:ubiquinone/menaquinone biosynthesis C-methylase UbiE
MSHFKRTLDRFGLLDYGIFVWEDQVKQFERARLLRNLKFRAQGAPDGLPLPPGYLIWLVVGTSDVQAFLDSGAVHASEFVNATLVKNGLAMNGFDSVLDFGCGCGRIMRYWKDVRGVTLYGTDYNRQLVEWCRRHLPFASFETNSLEPPLAFKGGEFDFVYARSVFTHLGEELQSAWMEEFRRVLKPGGYLLITVSGDQFLDLLSASERERYQSSHVVVRAVEMEGKNYCAVYHPPSYVRKVLVGDNFKVVDFIPGDAAKPYCLQDAYLLRTA